jgi:thioredoxin-like negative regulator of GroEL
MSTRRETLEQFVATDPDDSFSRYALALEFEKEQREADAITHLQEVITRDPGYVAAYYHLGRILARQGQTNAARQVYVSGLEAAIAARDERTRNEIQEALESLG